MTFFFYFFAIIAVLSTILTVISVNPIYMLLYFIISLFSISGIFFSLGNNFAGSMEIIIYAGAIMVLFIFVIMLLNLGPLLEKQEKSFLKPQIFIYSIGISLLLFLLITYQLASIKNYVLDKNLIKSQEIGINLFSHYLLMVELISFLLLSSLIVTFHVGRENYFLKDERNNSSKKTIKEINK
ncbi:NADH-quinone oxidoreductase subunit J [Candidatus Tachikawaea gelatinosa]|uniref:NADH-quinone oxidoreductase subunit J n=1 Tax=Candidatus Tachikawaea gelatinosa TaxID=1410383 RepID=A0A090BWB6_9ENTR|nr:NADH-quinone oxidoreductase subunit J [Candidatus Tachikawaea gelatinosa]BAP58321.1 NADH-quinone oxidoreductase subunit J [Candidatus Tachikawaea gelatinosa]